MELQGLPFLNIYMPLHAGNLKPRKSKKPNEVQRLLALLNDMMYAHYAATVSGASLMSVLQKTCTARILFLQMQEAQYVCLVRATDGNKKISTTVRTITVSASKHVAQHVDDIHDLVLRELLNYVQNLQVTNVLLITRLIALQVSAKDFSRFQESYATILKVLHS